MGFSLNDSLNIFGDTKSTGIYLEVAMADWFGSMATKPHLLVIDPAVKKPELDCFNQLSKVSPLPLTYHLPALAGMDSLNRETGNIKGILILGSACSVNQRLAWQAPLEDWLMKKLIIGIPTFGCCYGHQMLAYMFGGKVDYLYPDQKKLEGFRMIEFESNHLWEDKNLSGELCVTHNEAVIQLPKDFVVTAKSPEVAIDGIAHKTLPIWGLQAHPEATESFISKKGNLDFGYSILGYFFDFVLKGKNR